MGEEIILFCWEKKKALAYILLNVTKVINIKPKLYLPVWYSSLRRETLPFLALVFFALPEDYLEFDRLSL